MSERLTIYALDDDPADLKLLQRHLKNICYTEFDFAGFNTWQDFESHLEGDLIDVLILDYLLGAETGLEVVRKIREKKCDVPIIVLTGQGNETIAAEISRAGADDYLVKTDITPEVLRRSIENALLHHELTLEKKLLKEKTIQAGKFDSLNTMAGAVAHHFNNQLMIVIGNLEMIQRNMKNVIDERSASCFKSAGTAAKRAAELSGKMLDYVGQTALPNLQTDIVPIVEQVLKEIPEINVEINTIFDETPQILTDPIALKNAFRNIIENAVESLEDSGGILNISTGVEEYSADFFPQTYLKKELPSGEYVWVEIQDNGCGIKEENLPRIFDPFYTTKFTGRGLGLATVIGTIRAHKGAVDVDSAPDEGTAFRIYLPV